METSFFSSNVPTFNTSLLSPISGSTSKGNQPKWFHSRHNVFIKRQFEFQDCYWKDYLVEIIASEIGHQLGFNVVSQFICNIITETGQFKGCCSSNFLSEDEVYVTAYDLRKLPNFMQLPDNYDRISGTEKVEWLLKLFDTTVNLDASRYLFEMTLLDYLVANEDRHWNNFGAVYSVLGTTRIAPLFDFGLGLFEHDNKYDGLSLVTAMRKIKGQPILVDLHKALLAVKAVTGYSISGTIDLTQLHFPNRLSKPYIITCARNIGLEVQI